MKRVFLVFCSTFFALAAWADETALTAKNIQGGYTLVSGDGSSEVEIVLASKIVRLQLNENDAIVRCRGEYTFDRKSQIIDAKLYNCGADKISLNYMLFLSEQTLENLNAKTYALVSTTIDDQEAKTLPFSVLKTK